MTSTGRRLRVSIVLGSTTVPAWVAFLVARLRASPQFEVLLYLDPDSAPHGWPWAYRLYERADARVFRQQRDALAATQLPDPQARPLAEVAECDVVLRLAPENDDVAAQAAQCGVWTLSHSDDQAPCVPPLFWEMYRRDLYRTTLVARLPDGDRRLLYSSYGRPNRTSLHRGRNQAYWKAQGAISRALDAVYRRGPAYVRSRPRVETPPPCEERPLPSSSTIARHVAAVSFGVVGRRLRKVSFREEWFVATRVPGAGSLLDEHSQAVDGFLPLAAARGEHFADPFVFEDGGDTYLFLERYNERARRASIAYARLDVRANAISRPDSALTAGYHVSYPFVFRRGGDIFMIPESLENESVDLYRAVEFPSRWAFERRLLDGVWAVDATLHEEGSRLWLFVGLAEPGASVNDELHLYSSTALAGPWIPHPENPVVSDVRSARPAGRVFHHHGQLIRPAQDCSGGYGRAVVFNRIDLLTTDAYAESPIGRLEPTWAGGLSGTHTYNSTGRIEVVDGRRFALRVPVPHGRSAGRKRAKAVVAEESGKVAFQNTSVEAAQEDWNALAERGTNVFATWDWASTWWRHFGRGQALITSCRRLDGEPLALLPLYLRQHAGLRIVRFIGHGPADELGPLCASDDRPAVAAALRSVVEDARADIFLGEELRRSDAWSSHLGAKVRGTGSSPVLRLDGGTWEDFLLARSGNFRQQVRRRERALAQHGLRFRLCEDRARLDRDLDTLFALHRRRWTDGASEFGRLERFHRDFAARAFDHGWLRLWFLEVNGADVAVWYGLRFGGVDSYYQAGRDPAWDRFAVGFVLLAHSVREAIADGMKEYRLGRGAEEYKRRFADYDPELETLVLARGVKGRLAVAAAEALPRPVRARRIVRSALRT